MTPSLFDRVLVPVADPEDAEHTARALQQLPDLPNELIVGYVIEKASGAPDKASIAQREEVAADVFNAFLAEYPGEYQSSARVVTLYGRDIATTIQDAATQADATAIAFVPRDAHTVLKLLSGNTAVKLIEESSIPVLSLPDPD